MGSPGVVEARRRLRESIVKIVFRGVPGLVPLSMLAHTDRNII